MVGEGRVALAELRRAAAGFTDCELYREGTQTVFGEGPAAARIVFVPDLGVLTQPVGATSGPRRG